MSGYIGNIPTPQATQTRDTFTATAGQTTFATSGYTPSFLDVFLNGVHLVNGTDYTASNGSDVVLTSGAAAGDTLEVVAYSTYQVNSQNYTGGLTVDNDGATVLTVDRATSDGTIIDLQKDGTSAGNLGSLNSARDLHVNSTGGILTLESNFNSTERQVVFGDTYLGPRAADSGAVDLGRSVAKFKDLYLSGGVYLGGTGAANYLDDYETGTFTPTSVLALNGFSGSVTVDIADYQKVGDLVAIQIRLLLSSSSGNVAVGDKIILGSALPFTADSSIEITARIGYSDDAGGITETNLGQGGSNIRTTVHSVRGTCPRASSVLAIDAVYKAA